MRNELQIFKNTEFGEMRTVEENGKVLFCGSDIAKALGYSNSSDAISRHCKGIVKRDTHTSGGVQSLSYITEEKKIIYKRIDKCRQTQKYVIHY